MLPALLCQKDGAGHPHPYVQAEGVRQHPAHLTPLPHRGGSEQPQEGGENGSFCIHPAPGLSRPPRAQGSSPRAPGEGLRP